MTNDEFESLLRGDTSPIPVAQQEEELRRERPTPKRSGAGWAVFTVVIIILGGLVGGGFWGWSQYGERILNYLGEEEIPDYAGAGNAPEIILVIESGDIGEDVARKLSEEGVTASFEAVYQILLDDTSITFQPGTYRLLSEMSAQSALDAIANPENRVLYKVTIPEGVTLSRALEIISENSDIALADLEQAAADPTVYGVNPEGDSLEGYLFPATYTLEPGSSASDVVSMLVDEMIARLEGLDIAPDQWHEVLTKAALIQREARETEDFYKVSAVIDNRIADDMLLQFDSTVTYWENTYGTVWTTDEARANADNPYNTYFYPGLPPGPIGLPGATALDAAINPADAEYRYFVTVNLQSGATVFSETLSEHEAAVQLLREWCDVAENRPYCE
ncbi:MAG: endolytic transglycosylase MltG [Pontimonas sp.]